MEEREQKKEKQKEQKKRLLGTWQMQARSRPTHESRTTMELMRRKHR
jgi:hypothetical protein